MICPLCKNEACEEVDKSKWRVFFKCKNCTLIFIPSQYHVSIDEELNRYDLHHNTEDNEGYVKFLEEVANITIKYLNPNNKVLDFGCGKEAILCKIIREKGFRCEPFDPLYNYPLTQDKYDVIILCEVIEHCRDLQKVIDTISSYLKENGRVIIRTKIYPSDKDISKWWYSQDITHINFFSKLALDYTAKLLKKSLSITEVSDIFVIS